MILLLNYRKSSVHIKTSISDAFPLSILDSLLLGIPTLKYCLPEIQFHNIKGMLSISQGSIEHLTDAIIKITTNSKYLQ